MNLFNWYTRYSLVFNRLRTEAAVAVESRCRCEWMRGKYKHVYMMWWLLRYINARNFYLFLLTCASTNCRRFRIQITLVATASIMSSSIAVGTAFCILYRSTMWWNGTTVEAINWNIIRNAKKCLWVSVEKKKNGNYFHCRMHVILLPLSITLGCHLGNLRLSRPTQREHIFTHIRIIIRNLNWNGKQRLCDYMKWTTESRFIFFFFFMIPFLNSDLLRKFCCASLRQSVLA